MCSGEVTAATGFILFLVLMGLAFAYVHMTAKKADAPAPQPDKK